MRGAKGLRLTLVGTTSPKADYNLVPFGDHILYSVLEVGKGFAVGSGELLGPFCASYVSGGRLMADVVWVEDLLGGVEARITYRFVPPSPPPAEAAGGELSVAGLKNGSWS